MSYLTNVERPASGPTTPVRFAGGPLDGHLRVVPGSTERLIIRRSPEGQGMVLDDGYFGHWPVAGEYRWSGQMSSQRDKIDQHFEWHPAD